MKNHRIRILPRAVADLGRIIGWIYERSPRGASALLVAFEKAQLGLKRSPDAYTFAPESEVLGGSVGAGSMSTRMRRRSQSVSIPTETPGSYTRHAVLR